LKIQWTNGAVSEFIEGLGYVATFSPNRAAKMEEKILKYVDILSKQPLLGRIYEDVPEYRTLVVHKRYRIFYHIENIGNEDVVMIDAFWHTSRDKWSP